MSKEEIKLTEDQIDSLVNFWVEREDNPPSRKELISYVFPDIEDSLKDGRSVYGKAVTEALLSRNIKPASGHDYVRKRKVSLTDEQKEFIDNNVALMSGVEIAKIVFKDDSLTNLHQETKAVFEYIRTLPVESIGINETENATEGYKPPKTFITTLARINKYVNPQIDKDKITPKLRKGVEACMSYMSAYRFIHQASTYGTNTERELFESSFVRYTHDKSDLTQEEVDQYIVLSTEVVISSNIQIRINRLSTMLDNIADDTDGRRISMGLSDAISSDQTEYNQCVNRQQKLLDDLKEKRCKRLSKQHQDNASILNLVEAWKEQETREKMVNLAELRKESVKGEVSRISSMDEIKARVMGISEDEVLNG